MSKTMVYKHPGPHKIHRNNFDYKIVADEDLFNAFDEGWYLTTEEALDRGTAEAHKSEPISNAEPSRDEVKEKADELGIEYPSNIPTSKLRKMVEDKIDEID